MVIESVPRGEEGSTGKYQHEVEGVPEGAAQGLLPRPNAGIFLYSPTQVKVQTLSNL